MYESLRRVLFWLSAERAHNLAIGSLHRLPAPKKLAPHHPALKTTVCGIEFPSPLGLAAGFDKDAKAPGRMLAMGFGFVEVGTVTPQPQPGNLPPRLFRLEEDQAIINRFGFNSEGLNAVERRLARRNDKPGIVGVNLGANKDSRDKIADYVQGVRSVARYADYLAINISSPNTPGLRDLHSSEHLATLIERILEARQSVQGPPIFLKVSPDLSYQQIIQVARSATRAGVDGLMVGNTTTSRPAELVSKNAEEAGGLSGRPLKALALRTLKAFHSEVGSRVPLIGVGGIESAEDAYERIRAGASLIQLYTALAYEGPGIVTRINNGLVTLLNRDGLTSISQAVGRDSVSSTSYEPEVAPEKIHQTVALGY